MIPNIQINGKTLKQMAQTELSLIDNALTNVTRKNATPCITAAEKFLNAIKQEYEDLAAANILANHQYQIKKRIQNPDDNSNKVALSDQYQRNKQILRDMYARSQVVQLNLKMENFSKELNSFLGQQVQLAYVFTDSKSKNPVIFLVDDIGQIMKKDMGSKGAGIKSRINMSKKQAQQALKNKNSAIHKLSEQQYMTTQQIGNLQSSYNEVINRYNTYKYSVKNGSNRGKVVHIILWQPQIDWKIVVMGNNVGDIKQAYVAAVIGRKGFLSSEMEKNIDDLMNYVSQVDATPGMLQGDVSETLANGQTVEYAVKGASASFMSLELAIDLAIQILTADPLFDTAALKRKKEQYAKGIEPRNKQVLLQKLTELFEGKIPDEIKAVINIG